MVGDHLNLLGLSKGLFFHNYYLLIIPQILLVFLLLSAVQKGYFLANEPRLQKD